MKKKIILVATATVVAMSLVACGGSSDKKETTTALWQGSSNVADEEITQETTPEATSEEQSNNSAGITTAELKNYPETAAEEFDILEKDDCIEITGYHGKEEVLVIPSEINGNSNIKLVGLNTPNVDITALKIPGNVDVSECLPLYQDNLECVVLGEGIKSISRMCYNSEKLKYIEIPSTVEEIAKESFSSTAIEEIVVPEKVTELKTFLFKSLNSDSLRIELGDNISKIAIDTFRSDKKVTFVITEGSVTDKTVDELIERYSKTLKVEFVVEYK